MATKGKAKAKAKASSKSADKVDVVEEIATALGDHIKKQKGEFVFKDKEGKVVATGLKALIFAVADENCFTDKQYDALSKPAQDWLQKAEAILQKDQKADVPAPGEGEDKDATADSDSDSDDGEDADGDGDADGDDDDGDEGDEKPSKKSKAKKKQAKDEKLAKGGKDKKKPAAKAAAKKADKKPADKKKSKKKEAVPSKTTAEIAAAVAFAKKQDDKGPCGVIRAVADKFKTFERADVLAVAEALKINKYTASRQFQVARAGSK